MDSKEMNSRIEREKIEMIKRMTDYDDDVVYEKLIEFDGDYEKIIKEFMGGPKTTPVEAPKKTLNQEIFKQIRQHMDEASQSFYKN